MDDWSFHPLEVIRVVELCGIANEINRFRFNVCIPSHLF